jgi:argininosuccinate lyase
MTKLWGGRFSKGPKKEVLEFNSSENIELDSRLVKYDILGSIAHVKMLKKQKILNAEEAGKIISALNELQHEWENGKFVLDPSLEDVHMNVEAAVSAKTPHGKKMHTARSRNDQVLLDIRMYMRDSIKESMSRIKALQSALSKLSDGPMVGYTHTRVAQPITVSFWAEALANGLQRDYERLESCLSRVNRNPLGACAIAGTPWDIDRAYTARLLGFEGVQENELDTISSRGEMEAELLSALSIMMARLSGLAEEIIWLSEKGLIQLPDDLCTGSSIMPNKKNPDILELVRARSGRVYGNLMHILSVKKGLISGYHSDMQETKYALMQAVDTATPSLSIMEAAISGMGFNSNGIVCALDSGFAQATEIADFLAMNGVPFREAHERSGKLVKHCENRKTTLMRMDKSSAEQILGHKFSDNEWASLVSVERKRLMKKVRVPKS